MLRVLFDLFARGTTLYNVRVSDDDDCRGNDRGGLRRTTHIVFSTLVLQQYARWVDFCLSGNILLFYFVKYIRLRSKRVEQSARRIDRLNRICLINGVCL